METARQHSNISGEVSPGYSLGTPGTPGAHRGRGGAVLMRPYTC